MCMTFIVRSPWYDVIETIIIGSTLYCIWSESELRFTSTSVIVSDPQHH